MSVWPDTAFKKKRMYISPATEAQLAPINTALAELREHWRSFKHMPFACEFAGTIENVDALDYLDYEGLSYPRSDIDGAALVWGNVLAKQLGMIWGMSYHGDLLLRHNSPGNCITVWPYARVLEVQERDLPRYGRYAWLLDRVIHDCLQFGDLSGDARTWCQRVMGRWKQEGTPWE
ncbi:MAG: hypothetical protein JWQ71_3714 [Pedosphaera sp.]|nr:hypothetical protein [Pedosphaera sp.]